MLQKQVVLYMNFPGRLASLSKEKNLTQKELAELTSVHVAQIRHYESGSSQPTLDVIRKIAIALHVSADTLIFDEKETIKELLEGMLLKHEAKRWQQSSLVK